VQFSETGSSNAQSGSFIAAAGLSATTGTDTNTGWVHTVGDCRYNGNTASGHGNYDFLRASDGRVSGPFTMAGCIDFCAKDARCTAVDSYYPFDPSRECALFEDSAGVHSGDGTTTSQCWVPAADAGVCAGIRIGPGDTICDTVSGDWHASIAGSGVQAAFDPGLVCFIKAST
jgi:hypothetical protein